MAGMDGELACWREAQMGAQIFSEHLRRTSPSGLNISQHGGWVLIAFPRANIPREKEGKQPVLTKGDSELLRCNLGHGQLLKHHSTRETLG